jgi:hypothetical protein
MSSKKVSTRALEVIKKDFAIKQLLKNPPQFKKENINAIKRWIVDLSKLMIKK